jgi:magnesium transporter
VLGRYWVLTVQEEDESDVFDMVRQRISQSLGRVRLMGPDYLFCQLLRAVVEHYKITLEYYREQIDSLEDEVLDRPQENMVQEIVNFRKQINRIRKYTSPLREEISRLMMDRHPLIHKHQMAYLRDIQDNLNDLTQTFEQFREMLKDLSELYLSQLSHSMNQVMKTLTVVTALFIPLTFVAGVYGMNFAHMPELAWHWGYPAVLTLMALIGAGMWLWMKRKKWL